MKRAPKSTKNGHSISAVVSDKEEQIETTTMTASPHTGFKIMGLKPSPEIAAISLVYFVQGILGLARLALTFFLKDDLKLDPAQVAFLTGLSGLPWVIKPLYGFVSDTFPLFGYKRKSYMVVCGLLGTLSWAGLATIASTPSGAFVMMVLGSLSTACSDVVVDSIVVERARGEPQSTAGSLQSLCWGSAAVGGILSAYFSGSLVQDYGVRPVFAITAIFPLIVSIAALLIAEQPSPQGYQQLPAAEPSDSAASSSLGDSRSSPSKDLRHGAASGAASSGRIVQQLRSQGVALWAAVSKRSILFPTIFCFLWNATPSSETAMFYFQTNHLHFTPEFLGRVRLAGSLASLAGVGIYNMFLKSVPLKRMLLWTVLLGTALYSTQLILISGLNRQLGLSDQLFVLGDSVILTVLGQVAFMPILVLAARLCPEGVEATLFATLMSILNAGAFAGSAVGAALTDAFGVTSDNFDHLFGLTVVCIVANMLPAPFLGLLPDELDQAEGGEVRELQGTELVAQHSNKDED